MLKLSVLNVLERTFPVLNWSKNYRIDTGIADLVAGITIGLTLIPQSIAYASLAGLSPQYGLYSSLCGGLIYAAFGTIPQLNIAPTALLSLLTFSFTQNLTFSNVNGAIFLCFLSGIIELICGFLHLGFMVDFVSVPVVTAFTSAGAITIASSQIKNLLGLNFKAENFVGIWKNVFQHITEIQKWDTILGLSCCIILLSMRKLKNLGSPPLSDSNKMAHQPSTIKKIIWFISVARNAFVVIICSIIAFICDKNNLRPFSLTSQVPAGLPTVILPFQTNSTNTTTLDMLKELNTGIIIVPFIAILGNVAIAKAFADGKIIDASQEMIAVGVCNLIGSFLNSYPVNASFSRAAVSNASGVKTPLAGVYTTIMVVLSLTFLTPYFSFIPKPVLAAVIICAVIFMVEITIIKLLWNINRIDLLPFFITLISCLLLTIEIGILIGVCVDIIFILYNTARPKIRTELIKTDTLKYIKITPSTSAILFPSAQYIREKIIKCDRNIEIIVIDCSYVEKFDFTAIQCMAAFINDMGKFDKQVIFQECRESIKNKLENSCKTIKFIENDQELLEFLTGVNKKQLSSIIINTVIDNNNKSTDDTNL